MDATPLFDCADDGGEVVVQQYEVCYLPADVAAAPAHGDADVRTFEGRGIVDPIPGDGHDVSVRLQGFDDAELVLGADPREHVRLADDGAQLVARHPLELRAGHDARVPDPDPPGHRQ